MEEVEYVLIVYVIGRWRFQGSGGWEGIGCCSHSLEELLEVRERCR